MNSEPIFPSLGDVQDINIYVCGSLDDPEYHVERVNTIRTAPKGVTVHVFITSPGGDIDVADMYISAISDSQARVVTHGVGYVASAAVSIFLAGESYVVCEGSAYMLHNMQIETSGDLSSISKKAKFYEEYYREKTKKEYGKVLTDRELESITNGAEFYFDAETMKQRIGNCSGQPRELRITLKDDGYSKTFTQDAEVSDFKEYSLLELNQILSSMKIKPDPNDTWRDSVEKVIGYIRNLRGENE